MTETRDSLLEHFRTMRAALTAAIAGLSEDQMTEPTVDGWSVKDNLAHLAFWDDLRADEITRIAAGQATALKMSPEQDDVLNNLVHDVRASMSLSQVMWELEHSRRRLEAAIEAAPPEMLDPDRFGEAGLTSTHEADHARYITGWRRRMGY